MEEGLDLGIALADGLQEFDREGFGSDFSPGQKAEQFIHAVFDHGNKQAFSWRSCWPGKPGG
jgi:hypothetical protein